MLFIAGMILCSCGGSSKTEQNHKPLGTKCYRYINGNDSILMSFQEENSLILGELKYNFFEKDKNNGNIRGAIFGDTIFAEYDFFSEGKQSTREVAFLRKDSVLMEGYGEITMLNDRQVFANKKAIQFDSKIYLTEVACD